MITVNNLSGSNIDLVVDGTTYVLPTGKTEMEVTDGSSYSVTFSSGGSGPPPPPGGGDTFTEYGKLTVDDTSYNFVSAEAPLFYFLEGMVLGVLVFGTGYIIRIVKNVARQNPEV